MREPIVVVGLMGAGKSTVGTLLARRLGRELRDSDPDLQLAHGITAAETVAQHGVELLHEREAAHLLAALAEDPPVVVAAAASTVDRDECRAALKQAYVIWLDGPPALIAERMRTGKHRPHFSPDLEEMLTVQRKLRGPLMAEVADIHVDVTDKTPEQIADHVHETAGWPA